MRIAPARWAGCHSDPVSIPRCKKRLFTRSSGLHLSGANPLTRQYPCKEALHVRPWSLPASCLPRHLYIPVCRMLNGFVPETDVPERGTAETPEEGETGNRSKGWPGPCLIRTPAWLHSRPGEVPKKSAPRRGAVNHSLAASLTGYSTYRTRPGGWSCAGA
jgi:hypothetical protein